MDYFKDDELVKFNISSEDGTLSEDIVLPRLLINDIDTSVEYIGETFDVLSPLNVIIFCAFIIFFAFVEKTNILKIVIEYLEKIQ